MGRRKHSETRRSRAARPVVEELEAIQLLAGTIDFEPNDRWSPPWSATNLGSFTNGLKIISGEGELSLKSGDRRDSYVVTVGEGYSINVDVQPVTPKDAPQPAPPATFPVIPFNLRISNWDGSASTGTSVLILGKSISYVNRPDDVSFNNQYYIDIDQPSELYGKEDIPYQLTITISPPLPADIEVKSAKLNADSTLEFEYEFINVIDYNFDFKAYMSADATFTPPSSSSDYSDPRTDIELASYNRGGSLSSLPQTGKWSFNLRNIVLDPRRPYLIVVADPPSEGKPHGKIEESDETNNTAVVARTVALPDIEVTSASLSDGTARSIGFTFGVTGSVERFYVSLYRSANEILDSGDGLPLMTQEIVVPSSGEGTGIFDLPTLPLFDEQHPYAIVKVDSANRIPETNENNNTAAVRIFKPSIVPNSFAWDVAQGGVNYGYTVVGTLPTDVPIDFYWSSDSSFSAEADTLAASAVIGIGQRSSMIHIDPSVLTAPPMGTHYLVAAARSNSDYLQTYTSIIDYNTKIIVTSKYDSDIDINVIGRFLAIPGVITDESLTIQLSDSLAALRPYVSTWFGDQSVIQAHRKVDLFGSWDGKTYETDKFDPGKFREPILANTNAHLIDGSNLADVYTTIQVQALPGWYDDLVDKTEPVFNAVPGGPGGSLTGSYVLKGLVANLALSSGTTIPPDVPFVGGKKIGASAGFGYLIHVPLNIQSNPTVDGIARIALVVLDQIIYEIDFVSGGDSRGGDGGSAVFTVTHDFTLDPKSLEMNGGSGTTFAFKENGIIKDKSIYSDTQIISYYLVFYDLLADLGYALSAGAKVTRSPNSGFSLVPEDTFVNLGLTAAIKGTIDVGWFIPGGRLTSDLRTLLRRLHDRYPQIFPDALVPPALAWKSTAAGFLTVKSQVNYSGNAQGSLPIAFDFGGEVGLKAETQLVFNIGGINVIETKPLDIFALFNTKPSYKF